jgi:hypothetical protein
MNVYHASRNACGETAVTVNGSPLNPRNDLRNHSSTGFEWGYGGSGPAQLALAILAHHLGDDARALACYEEFKWTVISPLVDDEWSLTSDQIDAVLRGEFEAIPSLDDSEVY